MKSQPLTPELAHQFKDWEKRPYIHQPEFEATYDRLMAIDESRMPAPRPYHDDWKSR